MFDYTHAHREHRVREALLGLALLSRTLIRHGEIRLSVCWLIESWFMHRRWAPREPSPVRASPVWACIVHWLIEPCLMHRRWIGCAAADPVRLRGSRRQCVRALSGLARDTDTHALGWCSVQPLWPPTGVTNGRRTLCPLRPTGHVRGWWLLPSG